MGIYEVEAYKQRLAREHTAWQRHYREADAREALTLSIFRWLSMARADFPDVGARINDARLRAIAEVVADLFLSA